MTTTTPAEPDVRALAHEVAALLGPDWSVHPDEDWSRAWALHHEDGRRIRLYGPDFGSHRGRLCLYGLLPPMPQDERPDTTGLKAGDISVAGSSPAARVASEIQRRLLPKLDEAFAEFQRRLAELRALERARLEAARHVGSVPGLSEPARNRHDRMLTAYHLSWVGPRTGESSWLKRAARVEVNVDQKTVEPYVKVELSGLSPKLAEEVLRLVVARSETDRVLRALTED